MRKLIVLIGCVLATSTFSIYPPHKSKSQMIQKENITIVRQIDFVIDSITRRQKRIDYVTDVTLKAAKLVYIKTNNP